MELDLKAHDSAFAAFERAVEKIGSQSDFARACGCTPGNINQLLKKRRLLTGRFILKAEAATGVSRHELRPDLYPLDPAKAPSAGEPAAPSDPRPSGEAGSDGAPVPHAPHLSDPDAQDTCDRSAVLQLGELAA